ncbi:MAG: hydroxyacid dehydrogenase [Proteobacteria bacterium]|nr:hydroxyacid dehydrogenase [Pseudomonadota bacterium]MBU2228482.1 hydroxyacid dehydrogenase [Pseudomonadota bacterium]MBU2261385.1 hydroxyacid dehydrogenase [Pseudomonadota bacterium]
MNAKKVVYVPEFLPPVEPQLKILSEVVTVKTGMAADEADLIARTARADAVLLTAKTPMTGQVIRACPRLKIIAKYGVGVDNIDIEAATKKGIPVINVPAMNSNAVAELTIGLMLAIMRHIPRAGERMRNGGWRDESFLGAELAGSRIGVLGYGNIAKSVIRKLQGFDVERILVFSEFLPGDRPEYENVVFTDFRSVLTESDLVTVHVSLSSTTKNMIGAEQIGLMKRTAYLVNAARGPIVDEPALIAALNERRIAGAALDVFTEEPPSKDSPLLHMDNVVITPHLGGSTLRTRRQSVIVLVNNLVELLKGNSIDSKYVVNPEVYDGGLHSQCQEETIL